MGFLFLYLLLLILNSLEFVFYEMNTKYPIIIIKDNKVKLIKKSKHPWIFSGALQDIDRYKDYKKGEIVDVVDSKGNFICRGFFNKYSQIAVQVLTRNYNTIINKDFWNTALSNAIGRRKIFSENKNTNAYRLVFSSADYLPGLIVDKYADYVVIQSNTAGVDNHITDIVDIIDDILKPKGAIIEKSDSNVRKLEKLDNIYKVWKGSMPFDNKVIIKEHSLNILVDLKDGHKTGFYLDQKDNRLIAGKYAFKNNVLNCFSYTGAFGLYCLYNKANSVVNIDINKKSLDISNKNYQLNFKDNFSDACSFICDDTFSVLEDMKEQKLKFDLIILDPPKFINKMDDMKAGLKAYRKLNSLALDLLKREGILMSFSCSYHVGLELLQKVVFLAAADINKELYILKYLYQSQDHPININFPESLYLKGLVIQSIN